MPEFIYETLDEEDGSTTSDRIAADSVSAALAELESQGLHVISIKSIKKESVEKKEASLAPAASPRSAPPTTVDIDQQVLRQRLDEVLENRATLAPALTAFAEELPSGRTRRELRAVISQLESNVTAEQLFKSLSPNPRGSVQRPGKSEQSNGLGTCSKSDNQAASWLLLLGRGKDSRQLLSNLFEEATQGNEGSSQWNRALLYPAFVFLGSLCVLIFLCVTVVPTFKEIFDDFELCLPAITVWVIFVAGIVRFSTFGLALGLIASFAGIYLAFRLLSNFRLPGRIGNMLTKGNTFQVTAMARFTRRLAEALDAGFELPTALRIVSRIARERGSSHLALHLANDAQQKNFDVYKSRAAQRLPSSVVYALQAGKQGKPSIPLLRQIAENYLVKVRSRYHLGTSFIPHFSIIAMGFLVGFVVLALFIPLVELINGLTG